MQERRSGSQHLAGPGRRHRQHAEAARVVQERVGVALKTGYGARAVCEQNAAGELLAREACEQV